MNFLKRRQALLYPLLDIPLNGLNYLFLIVVSRHLTPDEYGIVNALLSVAALLMVIGQAAQTLTAKRVTETDGPHDLSPIAMVTLILIALIGIAYLGTVSWLGQVTRSGTVTVMLVYVVAALDALVAIYRGWCQGQRRFLLLNLHIYTVAGSKFLFLVLLLPFAPSPTIVVLSVLVGLGLSLVYPLWRCRSQFRQWLSMRRPLDITDTLKTIVGISMAQFLIQYLLSIDVILVNRFLPSDSGIYAVVAKYGQLIWFGAFSVYTVLFPVLNRAAQQTDRPRNLLRGVLLLYLLAVLVIVLAYRFFMPTTIPILFGERYLGAAPHLLYAAISYCLLSFFYLMVMLFVIQNNYFYLAFLLGAAVMVSLLYAQHHESIAQIMAVQIVVYSLLAVSLSGCWLIFEGHRGDNTIQKIWPIRLYKTDSIQPIRHPQNVGRTLK